MQDLLVISNINSEFSQGGDAIETGARTTLSVKQTSLPKRQQLHELLRGKLCRLTIEPHFHYNGLSDFVHKGSLNWLGWGVRELPLLHCFPSRTSLNKERGDWEFPNLVVCNFYLGALFCAPLRPLALFFAFLLSFAPFCALLRSFALSCRLTFVRFSRSFALFCMFLFPTVLRTVAFGNFRGEFSKTLRQGLVKPFGCRPVSQSPYGHNNLLRKSGYQRFVPTTGESSRGNTIRANRTESLWEGNLPLRGPLREPLQTAVKTLKTSKNL